MCLQAQSEKGEIMQTDLVIPERIETGIVDINQRALELKIINDATYQEAGSLFTLMGDMEREIKAFMDPLVDKAYQTHKALTSARFQELNKLLPGKNALNRGMVAYRDEQRRKAEEEAIKLREEQKKKDEEARLQAALEAEKDGDKITAEAILNETVIAEPIKPIETPKPEGVQFRVTYDFEIVVKDLIPREYMTPDLVAIRKVVNALKEKCLIPGIRVIKHTNAGRGR